MQIESNEHQHLSVSKLVILVANEPKRSPNLLKRRVYSSFLGVVPLLTLNKSMWVHNEIHSLNLVLKTTFHIVFINLKL